MRKQIIEKILTGKGLTEEEVEYAFYNFLCVDEDEDEHRRWSYYKTKIIKVENRYFSIYADIGLTEYQENYYEPQILEEVKPREKVITITEWVSVNLDDK